MRNIKYFLLVFFLMCSGCVFVDYNACGEGIPPKKADADIKKMFESCSSRTGSFLGDRSRLYYAAYAEGNHAEQKARENVAEKIRKDIVGKKYISVPLYHLELFKHFRYGDHYWGIYFIPAGEYRALRRKYR